MYALWVHLDVAMAVIIMYLGTFRNSQLLHVRLCLACVYNAKGLNFAEAANLHGVYKGSIELA